MTHKLHGNWDSGLAFDLHTVSSTHLGVDEHGHDRFENVRSEMGELVFQLKYRGDKSAAEKIAKLTDDIGGIEDFDFIVPIPATNKNRPYQPVDLISLAIGKRRGVKVLLGALSNDGKEELKSVTDPVARDELLAEAIGVVEPEQFNGKKVLLIDDLYRSGSTLKVATKNLREKGKPAKVSVFTMTKTRSNR
ncbi:ComF family protein [Erythrobacter aureus]|uniref:ComF family protein n=1 Tax=Erythrobacter aureus TaxID=2182384 RepID=A0A345YG37_9SPHN|nr:ComF family protein [Erythrobacter aureus]AXK42889.1 ComF family protein [Erythrobacter aureus]